MEFSVVEDNENNGLWKCSHWLTKKKGSSLLFIKKTNYPLFKLQIIMSLIFNSKETNGSEKLR